MSNVHCTLLLTCKKVFPSSLYSWKGAEFWPVMLLISTHPFLQHHVKLLSLLYSFHFRTREKCLTQSSSLLLTTRILVTQTIHQNFQMVWRWWHWNRSNWKPRWCCCQLGGYWQTREISSRHLIIILNTFVYYSLGTQFCQNYKLFCKWKVEASHNLDF